MNTSSGEDYPKRDLRNILKRNNFNSEESAFCTEDNLEESLKILFEEFESFGIAPITIHNDTQTSDSLVKLFVKMINATWNLIHKYRLLMGLHDQLLTSNHKIVSDDINLKNHVKRLKEDLQKIQHTLSKTQEIERKLKIQYENTSRDLKHEKEKVQKLEKQARSKVIQHEHQLRRIMQNNDKLQEQLQKSIGTFVSRDKGLRKLQEEHEKQVNLYKQTIYRLEESKRQMLQEISELKESLLLHSTAIDLQIEASGAWSDTNIG